MQLVSIVLMPLYTDKLSTAEYGVLQTLYRVGDVLNICLMMNGIRQASLNFWCSAKDEQQQARIPATVGLFTLCVIAIGILVAFATSGFLTSFFLKGMSPLLLACGTTAILFQASTMMPLALMQARLESVSYIIATVAILVMQLSLTIIGVAVLEWGVWGVVAAFAGTYGVMGIVLTARELLRADLKPDMGQFWQIVKFAAPFVPAGLCFFVLHSGDHFFLVKYFGAGVAGVYGLGYKLGKGVVLLAFQPLAQVWGAWMYRMVKNDDANEVFGQMYTRIIAACVWVGLTLLVFQDEVLALLSDPKFAGSAKVIAPLVFAHFFLVLNNLLDSAYYVKRRTDLKPWVALVGTVVMLVCYYALIPQYEEMGAAWATLIGFAFLATFNAAVAHQVLPVRFEWHRVAALLMLALGIFFASVPLNLGVGNFFIKLLLWGAFPTVVWLFLANGQERETIANALTKCTALIRTYKT